VKIALHPEVSVSVKVNVARSPEEADLQAQGVDVMAQMFERDTAAFTEDFDPNAEPGATADAAASGDTAAAGADADADAAAEEADQQA
jgi:large subunit ribosomal protein L9